MIGEIRARGHLPFIVGGTGFYYRALTRGLFPGPGKDDALRARLRRPLLAQDHQSQAVGAVRIDRPARRVFVGDELIELTRIEFDLLEALATRVGVAVSRRWLADHLGDVARDADDRVLDAHVSRLRRKLGAAGAQVVTVWGVGYRLEAGE